MLCSRRSDFRLILALWYFFYFTTYYSYTTCRELLDNLKSISCAKHHIKLYQAEATALKNPTV